MIRILLINIAFHLFQDDVNSCGIELYPNKDPREQVKLLVNDMKTLKIPRRILRSGWDISTAGS
mgnify:FL=1